MANPRHQTPQGQSVTKPGTPVEYPSRESEHDTNESEGNMFNPIFKGNVQGRKQCWPRSRSPYGVTQPQGVNVYIMGYTIYRKVLHDYIRNLYIFPTDLGPVSLKDRLIRDRVRVPPHSGAKFCYTWHSCTLLGFASCRKVIAENQGHRHQLMLWSQFI